MWSTGRNWWRRRSDRLGDAMSCVDSPCGPWFGGLSFGTRSIGTITSTGVVEVERLIFARVSYGRDILCDVEGDGANRFRSLSGFNRRSVRQGCQFRRDRGTDCGDFYRMVCIGGWRWGRNGQRRGNIQPVSLRPAFQKLTRTPRIGVQ